MNITLRQLRYFVEIAQSRSFSRAAEHLAVAQPALSQNIGALEEDLSVRLFVRHAKGVELSAAGQRLFAQAVDLLGRVDALKAQVAGGDGEASRPAGPVRLAPLLRAVAEQHPGIALTVGEGMSAEVRMQVESGHAHLALMPSPSELSGMESLPLFEERFMLFGAFAAMRRKPKQMRFADVVRLPLAAPDRAHDLRKVVERAASAANLRLDVRHELNSAPMLVAIVKEGLAFSIMPPSACAEALAAKSIASRAVVEPELSRVQAIVWPRDRALTPAAAAIRDTLVEVAAELLRQGTLQGRLLAPSHQKK